MTHKLRELKRDWDSYDGLPPTEENIAMAEKIAERLANIGEWQFVPCSDGSVQIEMHELGWDIEVWCQAIPQEDTTT